MNRLVGPSLNRELDDVRYAIGSLEARIARGQATTDSLQDAEFKVFSQFGEDGAIQYLVNQLSGIPTTFVEIGVQDYRESNTRFLAMHDNWAGLAVDSGDDHFTFINNSDAAWRWSIQPVKAFVTASSIDALLQQNHMQGDVGLVSIDVDGVDYWIWDAITSISPWIVVVEYNSYFGSQATVTVPYSAEFDVRAAHYSATYHGASLAALAHLGRSKGYRLVGSSANGVNAFFVRNDVAGELWDLKPQEAFVKARIRTQRNRAGHLTYNGDHDAIRREMQDQLLVDVVSGQQMTVGELT